MKITEEQLRQIIKEELVKEYQFGDGLRTLGNAMINGGNNVTVAADKTKQAVKTGANNVKQGVTNAYNQTKQAVQTGVNSVKQGANDLANLNNRLIAVEKKLGLR